MERWHIVLGALGAFMALIAFLAQVMQTDRREASEKRQAIFQHFEDRLNRQAERMTGLDMRLNTIAEVATKELALLDRKLLILACQTGGTTLCPARASTPGPTQDPTIAGDQE